MDYRAARCVALTWVLSLGVSNGAHGQTLAWRQLPSTGLPGVPWACVVFDPSVARTVLIGGGSGPSAVTVTYEFDGTSWSQRNTSGTAPVPTSQVACFYDSARGSIFWVGQTPAGGAVNQTYELTGSVWNVRTTAGANVGGPISGAYRHPGRGLDWVINTGTVWEITPPTMDWVEFTTNWPIWSSPGRGTFDTNRSVPVGLVTLQNGTVWFAELTATSWIVKGQITTPTGFFTGLAYDAHRSVSVAFLSDPKQFAEWNGTTVTPRSLASGPSGFGSVSYDATRMTLVLVDSTNNSVWELGAYTNQGGTCVVGAECLSGHCADGRCCDVPCGGSSTGDCQACSVAAGATTNGTCRTLPATVTCRASVGVCDVAESCSGTSTACPADGFASASTICRPSSMPCDVAETCPGNAAACPAIDGVADGTVVCRPSAGTCDVAESCNGVSKTCPADLKQTGVVCRSSQTLCDLQEICDGSNDACPPDAFAAQGTVCDASSGVCDAVDHCTGSSIVCPEELAPDDTACDDQNACTQASVCRTGVCTETLRLDCTDGNACTLDTCQDAIGSCVHTPIAACSGDASVGSDAGAALDAGDATPAAAAGCSCHVAGAPGSDGALAYVAAMLAFGLSRRGRRRRA